MNHRTVKALAAATILAMGVAACSSSGSSTSSSSTPRPRPRRAHRWSSSTTPAAVRPDRSTPRLDLPGRARTTCSRPDLRAAARFQHRCSRPQAPIPWLATGYAWSNGGKTLTFTIRQGREVQRRQADHRQRRGVHLQPADEQPDAALQAPAPTPLPVSATRAERDHGRAHVRPAGVRQPVPDRVDLHPAAAHLVRACQQPGDVRRRQAGRHRPVQLDLVLRRRGSRSSRTRTTGRRPRCTCPRSTSPATEQHQRQPGPAGISGQIDFAGNYVANIKSEFPGHEPGQPHLAGQPAVLQRQQRGELYLNTTKAPLNDPAVRQAISYRDRPAAAQRPGRDRLRAAGHHDQRAAAAQPPVATWTRRWPTISRPPVTRPRSPRS